MIDYIYAILRYLYLSFFPYTMGQQQTLSLSADKIFMQIKYICKHFFPGIPKNLAKSFFFLRVGWVVR